MISISIDIVTYLIMLAFGIFVGYQYKQAELSLEIAILRIRNSELEDLNNQLKYVCEQFVKEETACVEEDK